jgi:hypothetical protein
MVVQEILGFGLVFPNDTHDAISFI